MQFRPVLIAATAMVMGTVAIHATPLTSYSVTVSEGVTNGSYFDTTAGDPFAGQSNSANASFTYTGAIDFSNKTAQNGPSKTGDQNSAFGFSSSNITNYSGSGIVKYNKTNVANFGSLDQFLQSSGSASGYSYGSYYTFDLGVLAAGTVLTITHDDGVSVYQGGTRVGSTVSGATTQVTEMVNIANTGDTILRYARENGTPSILQVSSTVTPEPSSLALLGTGLLGLAGMVRRRLA